MPKGYAIHDTKNWTDFKVIDFDLKVRYMIKLMAGAGRRRHRCRHYPLWYLRLGPAHGLGWLVCIFAFVPANARGPLKVPAVIPGHEIVGKVTSTYFFVSHDRGRQERQGRQGR